MDAHETSDPRVEGNARSMELTAEAARAFVERDYAAWNAHDIDRVLEGWTEDVVWDQPFTPPSRARGHAQGRNVLRVLWTAFPDLVITAGQTYAAPDGTAVTAWRSTSTFRGPLVPPGFAPTYGRVELRGVDIWELVDGKARCIHTIADMMVAGRQMGALPAHGTFAERLGVLMQRIAARRLRRRATGTG